MTYDPRYAKRWRLDQARGLPRLVDATEVRLHIATLRGAGWSLRAISGAAGVALTTTCDLARGDQPTIRRTTAKRILDVDPHQLPKASSRGVTEPFVPRIGTVRRIQALLYMGWGHAEMHSHCGLRTTNLLHQQGRWVTRSTHDTVASMYRDLSHRPGPSSKARAYALQHGYHGPLAWDDIDLDPEPDVLEDSGRWSTQAPTTTQERLAELDHLTSLGVPLPEAILRAGWPSIDAWEKATERLKQEGAA